MYKNILATLAICISLFLSCASKIEVAEDAGINETRKVSFVLSSPEKDFVLTKAGEAERTWKVYGFDDAYKLEFSQEGKMGSANAETIEMELENGKTYRLLFLVAADGVKLPEMKQGASYWTMGLYGPSLPIANPKALMVSKGNDKGLLKLDAEQSKVRVGLLPLVTRVKFESNVSGVEFKSMMLSSACKGTFWSIIDNYSYTADGIKIGNGVIPEIGKTDYSATVENNVAYILPDLCTSKGMSATLTVMENGANKEISVAVPQNMALKMGAGRTYYVSVSAGSEGTLSASWALRSVNAGHETGISFDESEYQTDEYTLTKGIDGSALDLSESSYNRKSIFAEAVDPTDFSKSFTVGIWVKTTAKFQGTKAIFTNKSKFTGKGIALTTQDNGSWMFLFTDGSHDQWEYKPTAQRQPINDGEWHFLAVTFNKNKQEMRMYYDGLNVAIYSTNGNIDFNSGRALRIGSIDDTSWNCFNGAVDEFVFSDKVMSADQIGTIYTDLSRKLVNKPELAAKIDGFRVMDFNIWHGGHEFGEEVGVQRVVDVIKEADPDIVGIIETYGSGAEIADALGYYFHLRSSNLSIMSRFPIEDTYDFYDSFKCSAATIRVSKSQKLNYINLWLNYLPSTHDQVVVRKDKVEDIVAGEWTTRAAELKGMMDNAGVMTSDAKTPMIVSGDFNSDSHLDWCESAKDMHYGYVLPWPTSILMKERGFKDSYREIYPDPVKNPCLTWSPYSKSDLQYRIDFIYYKSSDIKATAAQMIDHHPVRFPSDHAAITTDFKYNN